MPRLPVVAWRGEAAVAMNLADFFLTHTEYLAIRIVLVIGDRLLTQSQPLKKEFVWFHK